MSISSLIVSVVFWKRKACCYLCCSVLCLLYSILYTFVNQPPVGLIGTAFYEVLRVCEMAVPVLLFAAVLWLCGKKNPVPCLAAGLICAVRIGKFIWVRHYIDMLLAAGESAFELAELGILANNINTVVMGFLFFLLNVALVWHLKKHSLPVGAGEDEPV